MTSQCLPISDMSAQPNTSHSTGSGKQSRLRILHVDDNPMCREITRRTLRREGHTITSAPDAVEGERLLTDHPEDFDLLITDHEMPIRTGLEFVSRLAGNPFRGGILVFSGALTPHLIDEYRHVGITHYLAKPTSVREIAEAVSAFQPHQIRA